MDLNNVYCFGAELNKKDLIDFVYLNTHEPFNMVLGWYALGTRNGETIYSVTATIDKERIYLDMLYALKAYGFETV